MRKTLALAVFCASLGYAQTNLLHVTVNLEDAIVKDFFGFGVEWDSNAYLQHRLDDADFALIRSRVEWMRLPLSRIMMLSNLKENNP